MGGLKLRLFGDHVHHAAGILHAIQYRSRAFEYLHPLGGGRKQMGLRHLHTVAQYRIVAVVAKAAFHHRIQRAGQRVGLADAADGLQGFVQRAGAAVFQYRRGHHINAARNLHQRRVAATDDISGNRLVAVVVAAFGGNFNTFQFGAVGRRLGFLSQYRRAADGGQRQHQRGACETGQGRVAGSGIGGVHV